MDYRPENPTLTPRDIDLPWFCVCPKCRPTVTMGIETVVPLIFASSTIVTYKCGECGHRMDVMEV